MNNLKYIKREFKFPRIISFPKYTPKIKVKKKDGGNTNEVERTPTISFKIKNGIVEKEHFNLKELFENVDESDTNVLNTCLEQKDIQYDRNIDKNASTKIKYKTTNKNTLSIHLMPKRKYHDYIKDNKNVPSNNFQSTSMKQSSRNSNTKKNGIKHTKSSYLKQTNVDHQNPETAYKREIKQENKYNHSRRNVEVLEYSSEQTNKYIANNSEIYNAAHKRDRSNGFHRNSMKSPDLKQSMLDPRSNKYRLNNSNGTRIYQNQYKNQRNDLDQKRFQVSSNQTNKESKYKDQSLYQSKKINFQQDKYTNFQDNRFDKNQYREPKTNKYSTDNPYPNTKDSYNKRPINRRNHETMDPRLIRNINPYKQDSRNDYSDNKYNPIDHRKQIIKNDNSKTRYDDQVVTDYKNIKIGRMSNDTANYQHQFDTNHGEKDLKKFEKLNKRSSQMYNTRGNHKSFTNNKYNNYEEKSRKTNKEDISNTDQLNKIKSSENQSSSKDKEFQNVITNYLGNRKDSNSDSICKTDKEFTCVRDQPCIDSSLPNTEKVPIIFENLLHNYGITELSSIQSCVYKTILAGSNLVFSSPFGTGKTFAYLLPILERIDKNIQKNPCLIVLVNISQVYQLKDIMNTFINTLNINTEILKKSEITCDNPRTIYLTTYFTFMEFFENENFNINMFSNIVFDDFDIAFEKNDMFQACLKFNKKPFNQTQNVLCSSMPLHIHHKNVITDVFHELSEYSGNPNMFANKTKFIFKKLKLVETRDTFLIDINNLLNENRKILVFCNRSSTITFLSNILNNNQIKHQTFLSNKRKIYEEMKQFGKEYNLALCMNLRMCGIDLNVDTIFIYELYPALKNFMSRITQTDKMYHTYTNQPLVLSYLTKNNHVQFGRIFQKYINNAIDFNSLKNFKHHDQ